MDSCHETSPFNGQSQQPLFAGIRFVLVGYHDPINRAEVSQKLVTAGAVDAGSKYTADCTHVIFNNIVYDDPVCVAARRDGKRLVSGLWVDHSLYAAEPLKDFVFYEPPRDLNGIPGAKSLVIGVTGYLSYEKEIVRVMANLMGAKFTKQLKADTVTHLVCYKFEGAQYELAKIMKRIKLVNHKWLEDCLKKWEILPEEDYSKSGHDVLEMEAKAKDSKDEAEGTTTRLNEVPRSPSNTSAHTHRGFSNAENVVSATTKSSSDQFSNPYEIKSRHPGTGTVFGDTTGPSTIFEGTASGSTTKNNIMAASIHGKRKMDVSSGSSKLQRISLDDDISIRENSHVESAQELRKNPQAEISYINTSAAHSPAKITPSKPVGRKSSGLKGKDVTADISYLNNIAATSPAKNTPSKITGRKSPGFKGKNITGDVAVSKMPTPEIVQDKDFDVVQRPQKDYRETSLATKVDNSDIGVAVNVMQGLEKSSSAISSDLKKSSTPNLENNDVGAGTNSKSLKRKSLGKKFSAPSQSLDKKKTASQKGSIYLNSSQPKTDATTSTADENLSSSKVFEVHPEAKSATEIVMEVGDDLMSGNKSLCMDDETEPPEDNEEGLNGEPANTVDIVMKEIAEADPVDVGQNNDKDGYSTERGNLISMENNVPVDKSGDAENLGSDKTSGRKKRLSTKKGKKKENVNKKAAQKKELANDNNNEKTEFTEEVTLDRAEMANNDVNELDAVNDHEHKIEEKKDDGTEMDADLVTENVVNKKETKKTKSPLSKAKTRNDISVKEVARTKPVSKRRKPTSDGLAAAFDLEAQENMQVPDADAVPVHDDHLEKKTDDGTDKVSDVNMENDVNKNVTKISKPTLRKTRKDAALSVEQETDNIADNQKIKPTSSRSVQAQILEAQKKTQITAAAADDDFENRNDKKDDDVTEMDIDTDANKETKKNKRPLSKTKKDPALSVKVVTETKAVKKKGKTTSSRSVKARDMEAQKENMEIAEDDRSTDNKQVLKSATEGSEKVTRKSDKADSEPKWFILTGHSLQRREFQQLIRRLKGRVCKVSHQWSYQATHFIVPDPIKRTEKFFAAAASGRWILKTDYLTASSQAGKFLAEEPYEWHKNGLSEDGQINLEAPRKWRLLKEKTGYGAFHGMRIVIYGECIAPSLDTLKRAVKAGDGTILATSPPYTRFLDTGIDFAVVSPGMPHVDIWVQEFLSHEIPCIAADYLVEYVCKPGYPLDGHVQYDTNVWAERSYNNLKKQLDEEDNTGPRTPDSNDVACEVCGLHDRGEEMLICGDESGSIGCGVGTHIDCCDPPLDDIPDDDWFCPKCTKAMNSMAKKSNKRKGK